MGAENFEKTILLCMEDSKEASYACELNSYGVDTVSFSGYGLNVMDYIQKKLPCAIIMDCFAQDVDALGVLAELTEHCVALGKRPLVLVVLPRHNNKLMNILLEKGADYVFIGIPSVSTLMTALRAILGLNNSKDYKERRLGELLEKLGVSRGAKGFNLIADAILSIVADRENLSGITKCLYPDIAKKHGTTAYTAEKEIRICIAKAWQSPSRSRTETSRCFGTIDDSPNLKPSNKVFLENVARYFETEYMEA